MPSLSIVSAPASGKSFARSTSQAERVPRIKGFKLFSRCIATSTHLNTYFKFCLKIMANDDELHNATPSSAGIMRNPEEISIIEATSLHARKYLSTRSRLPLLVAKFFQGNHQWRRTLHDHEQFWYFLWVMIKIEAWMFLRYNSLHRYTLQTSQTHLWLSVDQSSCSMGRESLFVLLCVVFR